MSKSLKSYETKEERKKAIKRRIESQTKGLGYWAAIDAQKHEEKKDNESK